MAFKAFVVQLVQLARADYGATRERQEKITTKRRSSRFTTRLSASTRDLAVQLKRIGQLQVELDEVRVTVKRLLER